MKFSHTYQTNGLIFVLLLILPAESFIQGKFQLTKPNICLRCDFKGGKKIKRCPLEFDIANIKEKVEIVECGYQKPICGITVNVTDKPTVVYAGCYSKKFDRHCFKDLVWQYGPINTSYCYHTCSEFFCNPYDTWLKGQSSTFNLFKILG